MRSHRREPDSGQPGRLTDGSAAATSAEPRPYATPPVAGLALRRQSGGADPLGGTAIPTDIVSALRRRQGGGDTLPSQLAAAGEQALGMDLSGVRVHTDPEAASIARSVQAVAFTHGSDIYFSPGSYRPTDAGGQRLIAHELGHVGQPGSGGGAVIGRADDPAEAAADRSADTVLSALRRTAAPAATGNAAADREATGVLPALRRQASRTPVASVRTPDEASMATHLRTSAAVGAVAD